MKDVSTFRKAAIRRMSLATGRTPNELKRMEVLRRLRKLSMPAGSASETTEPEPKKQPSRPLDTSKREQPPTSAAPLIQLESPRQMDVPPVAQSLGFSVLPPAPGTQASPDSATASPEATGPKDGRTKRKAKGHITISAPTPEPDAENKRSPYARRRSTIHGPPVLGYSEILRRPSIKVTLLEPVSESGPELEKEAAEQVKKAVKDFRRKSIAALRKQMLAGAPSSRMSIAGQGGVGPFLGPLQPRLSVSEENFLRGRPSISILPPYMVDTRRSISVSPNLSDPRRSVSQEIVPPYGGLLRRSSSVAPPGGFQPELAASRLSVSGRGFGPRPFFAASRRSVGGGPPFGRRPSARPSVSAFSGSLPGESAAESDVFTPAELAHLRAIALASTSSGSDED